jgi:hypothetical protein
MKLAAKSRVRETPCAVSQQRARRIRNLSLCAGLPTAHARSHSSWERHFLRQTQDMLCRDSPACLSDLVVFGWPVYRSLGGASSKALLHAHEDCRRQPSCRRARKRFRKSDGASTLTSRVHDKTQRISSFRPVRRRGVHQPSIPDNPCSRRAPHCPRTSAFLRTFVLVFRSNKLYTRDAGEEKSLWSALRSFGPTSGSLGGSNRGK